MQVFTLLGTAIIAGTFSVTSAGDAWADRQDAERILAAFHENDVFNAGVDSDSADRIRYSDRLTMLTQRVAAASCALTSDIAIEESHDHLEEAMHEIDIILDALLVGNENLHIMGAEKKKRIVLDIDALKQEW